MQQILLVQGIDFVVGVFLDEIRMDDEGFALVFPAIECLDTIQGETTRETSHSPEKTFERLGKGMADVVFVDLILV